MENEKIYLDQEKRVYLEPYLLDTFYLPESLKKKPALIILPGGCYLYKSYREGEPVAYQFSALGYQCFVLSYSTIWEKRFLNEDEVELLPNCPYPQQVYDLYRAIAYVREHAEEFSVDPDKIFTLGFSAGGHVCAAGAVNLDNQDYLRAAGVTKEQAKPNATVLCYPMVDAALLNQRYDEKAVSLDFRLKYLQQAVFGDKEPTQKDWDEMALIGKVTEGVPPFFIWHTSQDKVTFAEDTTAFVEALLKHHVYCEYHLFSMGHHGMSLATPTVARAEDDFLLVNSIWPQLADQFLKNLP